MAIPLAGCSNWSCRESRSESAGNDWVTNTIKFGIRIRFNGIDFRDCDGTNILVVPNGRIFELESNRVGHEGEGVDE